MPLSITTSPIKYKDPTTGNYVNIIGTQGPPGIGITSIIKTSTDNLIDTYTITFDDTNTSTFTVTNGSSISSIAKTGTSGLVDTYTITLTNGDTTTFEVRNGITPIISIGTVTTGETAAASFSGTADNLSLNLTLPVNSNSNSGIEDVKVNNTSIVSNGTANIPVASTSNLGVIKTNSQSPIEINDNNELSLSLADSTKIKSGTDTSYPLGVSKQHESVFYGLAKAAGDTTQSSSSNSVGTYTAAARSAIQTMLGITQTITVTATTPSGASVTGQTVYLRENNENGILFASAAYEGQPISFAVPLGFHYYISITDTLNNHFNPTTATGLVTNTDISVTLQYKDISTIVTAQDVKRALDLGADLSVLVGETVTCLKNGDTLTWDVVDYDSTTSTVTLLLHEPLNYNDLPFEPEQVLLWCETGLTAGSYSFTDSSTTYYFTLTTDIPVGGQLRATISNFQTYASQSSTSTLETGLVNTTSIANATDLGTTGQNNLNVMSRVNGGSGNFGESAIFWWLNTDAAANTPRTLVTKFSRAYSYSVPGFLNGLESSFIDCLDDTVWKCSTNHNYECPQSLGGITTGHKKTYTVTAKVGLASEMEIMGSYDGTADGSTIFDLYNGATATDRIKYKNSTAIGWLTRSARRWTPGYVNYITDAGASNGTATYVGTMGIVPVVKISATVAET